MIIQVRGTSGSGKSTVIRKVMEKLSPWVPMRDQENKKRQKPLYYLSRDFPIAVLGHYESQCGGCDTIGSAKQIYETIQRLTPGIVPRTILCEGLLLSEDTKWSLQLKNLKAIFLTTPVEECLRRIEGRRKEAGNEKPLNPHNTVNRVGVIERARVKLEKAGVDCRQCSSEEAPEVIMQLLHTKEYK